MKSRGVGVMKKWKDVIVDGLWTTGIMAAAFVVNQLFVQMFHTRSMISVFFVLGVFLVSLKTRIYFWGIGASLVSALMVNYSFVYPHFGEMITPEGLSSAVVMLIVSIATGIMTTKIKRQNKIKAEAERERMRGNLLRAVSHDLRTPLTAIHSACSAMVENYDALTEQQHKKLLEDIRSESMWMARVVENLLSVTRLNGEAAPLRLQDTVLEELIDALLVKFHKYYPRQKLELSLPEDFLVIPMDPALIQQVLMNLLENAVFHAKGMQHLVLAVEEENGKAVFYVRDDGCGIAPERMETLFSSIPDRKETTDSRRSNMEIGLNVCRAIIMAHGGEITAGNRETGGAEFRFSLEIKEKEYGE